MNDSDLSYYRQRAAQERRVAAACTDGAVSCAHRTMAQAYESMIATGARESYVAASTAERRAGSR